MVRTVLYILMVLGVMASGRSVVFGETSLLQKNWFAPRMASFCKNSESPNSINRFSLRSSNCQQGGGGEPTPSSLTFSKNQEPFDIQKATNLPSLANQGGSRIVQASKEIPLLARHLTAGLQLAYRDPFLQSAALPSLTNRMGAQIVLNGDWDTMKYHAEYGYAGQESGRLPLSTPSGKMGGKVKWEWNLPLVTPQIELSRYSDNLESDPLRARTVASMQKLSLNWGLSQGSQLSLAYGREQRDVFSQPDGPLANSMTTDSALAKLSLTHSIGTGFWSTQYRTSKNTFGETTNRQEIGSTMGGTFHLSSPVDIVPEWGVLRQTDTQDGPITDRIFGNLGSVFRLGSTQEIKPRLEFRRNHNYQVTEHTDAFSAKLDYSYKTWDDSLQVAMSGQYVFQQTSLNNDTPQICDLALLVHTDLHPFFRLPHRQQTLSVKISHNQRIDAFSSQIPPAQTTAMLLVSIAP
ncbi:MAG: hypothetical protein KC563_03420 [Nitrospira sp.]|nr:hypothetical protein [Nitrospira sp.]MCA9465417.1 hypothetical protein [Nitrospira sp.]MCA9474847.1 hypothetical protein [Nitrospira sp.]MCA9479279.1 hypothetical protein [Nitrospira sp.]MCB9711596.1 hypothetical protein [Nitrospiraceae bacterium]